MSNEATPELDVAALQRRLYEAEETLRAIREGEVDAVVIRGADDLSDEVFTLEGGVESYRTFMEAMDPGAVALDEYLSVLYANGSLCALLGVSAETLQGRHFLEFFNAENAEQLKQLVAALQQEKQSVEIKWLAKEKLSSFLVSATRLRLGLLAGYALTFTDLTERNRAKAAEDSERAARAIMASANEAVVVCNLDGVVTHINSAALAICKSNSVGLPFKDAVRLQFDTESLFTLTEDFISLAIAGSPIQGIEAHAPDASRVKDILISAAPLEASGQGISGCVVTMVDLTHRKEAERQQLLLMGELDHRVKNTLQLVLSICAHTAKNASDLAAFQASFIGRIQALSATHNLLAATSWEKLRLDEIVLSELKPYLGANAGRVTLDNVEVSVSARAATALGLIFHELVTNAVKYGALSNNEGRIVIGRGQETPNALIVEWKETGGPRVLPPKRQGFGKDLIGRSLTYSEDGGAEVDFREEGIICRISIPMADVVKKPAP